MKKIVIIHFQPLELYPPIQNLINFLKESKELKIEIYTTQYDLPIDSFAQFSGQINIVRYGSFSRKMPAILRFLNYAYFYFFTCLRLIKTWPDKVLYFETLSSFPAYIYKRFFNNSAKILIHYHEYTSKAEYSNGMILTKYFHNLEKWLYPISSWLSHTNEYRMKLFVRDIIPVSILNKKILPNYPPLNWYTVPKTNFRSPVKFIFVGNLSLANMYTKEFANWVHSQNGKFLWKIYSLNLTDDAKEFLVVLNSPFIQICPGVNYADLPDKIKENDIGVILYKGHIPNYIYNAPNKLFEYLVCGLDVWFPKEMIGSHEYISRNAIPKVVDIDFANITKINVNELLDRNTEKINENQYFAEKSLVKIKECLLNEI